MINFEDNEKEEDEEEEDDSEPKATVPTIIGLHTGVCADENTIQHVSKVIDIPSEQPELNAGTYITAHLYNNFIKPFIKKHSPKD